MIGNAQMEINDNHFNTEISESRGSFRGQCYLLLRISYGKVLQGDFKNYLLFVSSAWAYFKSVSSGERQQGVCCASSHPLAQLIVREMKLPIISVTINNSLRRALVDNGCTSTIVHSSVAEE